MTNKSSSCSLHCQPSLPELKLYQAFIFSIPILFTLVLLLLFYMLYLRRRRRTAWIASQMRIQYQDRGFISAPSERGLKKEFRDMLPIMIFNQSFLNEDTQCAVCLGEYEANEKLQQLPVCGHAFHLECIDHWLANNTTCPLCRTSLLQAAKVVPLDSPAHVAVPQQTHNLMEAPTLQQVHPIQDLAVRESPDMPNTLREEENRPSSGRSSDETNSSHLDIDEGEIYVAVPQGVHSMVNSDIALSVECAEK